MNDNNILAVVLAGGKSRRFGEDKNHAKLDGVTLLDHVLKKVSNLSAPPPKKVFLENPPKSA